jgi:hypothetical protein
MGCGVVDDPLDDDLLEVGFEPAISSRKEPVRRVRRRNRWLGSRLVAALLAALLLSAVGAASGGGAASASSGSADDVAAGGQLFQT